METTRLIAKSFRYLPFLVFILLNETPIIAQQPSFPHPWFRTERIADGIWCIHDGDIDNMYLLAGRDSALLIDNGTGAADLLPYLRTITKLPIIAVNTHSHPDHTGSINQLRKVYAHPDDFNMMRFFSTNKFRKSYIASMGLGRVPDSVQFHPKDTTYLPVFVPVSDGFVFDLGGQKVEVIHVPGHTPGSICLLDRKSRRLFTGDSNNTLVWLHTQDAKPLDVYLASLQKELSQSKQFDTILPAHGSPIDKSFIEEQISCVKEIISGQCVGKPYESFVGKGLLCGYKRAQVAYDPMKIKSKIPK